MSGYLKRDSRFGFGILPEPMLELTPWSPMARLLWGVLDSFGAVAFPGIPRIAFRMGLKPSNHKSVIRYVRELINGGGLTAEICPGQPTIYTLTLPDYCWVKNPETLKFAVDQDVKTPSPLPPPSRQRKIPRMAGLDRIAYIEKCRERKEKIEKARAATLGQASQGPETTLGQASQGVGDRGPVHPGTGVPGIGSNIGIAKEEDGPGRDQGFGGGPSPSQQLRLEAPKVDTLEQITADRAGHADKARVPGDEAASRLRRYPWIEKHFKGWPELFERATGRQFVWVKAEIDAAQVIARDLPHELIPGTLENFALRSWWRDKGLSLKKLSTNLTEFTPARRKAPAKATAPEKEQPKETPLDASLQAAMMRHAASMKAREAGASQAEIQRILLDPEWKP